jgi:uncharacterized tellurite resistance protein B-like protein
MLSSMLFEWLFGEKQDTAATASGELRQLVAHSMPGADAHTAAIVGATAGLLATVAHADRKYTEAEREAVRDSLSKVQGLGAGAFTAIEELLSERVAELAHEPLQTYTRVLYEGLERPARAEVFEALMDLAAADEVLDMNETNLLRRIARALGLSDHEYNDSQARHRQRLSVLRG